MAQINWCTENELDCGASLPTVAYFCVPEAIAPGGVVEGAVLSVRASTKNDYCGACRFIYTLEYNPAQLNEGYTLTPQAVNQVICTKCLIDLIQFLITQNTGGLAWQTLGNVGTVAGANFAGTIDNVRYDIRVNNQIARKTIPGTTPSIADGFPTNIVDGPGDVISGGGASGVANSIVLSQGFNFLGSGTSNNINTSEHAVIAGGQENSLEGNHSFIGAGSSNTINESLLSTIVGGTNHTILAGGYHFVGGGTQNVITTDNGTTINVIVGGSNNNLTDATGSVIVGGTSNLIHFPPTFDYQPLFLNYNFIGGGNDNEISTNGSTLGRPSLHNSVTGGEDNKIYGQEWGFIGGGWSNWITNTLPYDPEVRACMGNAILGGLGNTIQNGFGTSHLGGMSLRLGSYSCGFQAGTNIELPWAPSQVELDAFSGITFFGDTDVWIGNTNNVARALKLFCPNTAMNYSGAFFSSFESQAQSDDIRYVLPANLPSIGDFLGVQNVVGNTVYLAWAIP